MYRWCKIKKRTGNALWHGRDLGAVTPDVKIDIVDQSPPPPPPPPVPRRMPARLIKPQPATVKRSRTP